MTLPTVPEGHRLAIRALNADRSGSNGRWPQKRRWTPTVERPVLCKRGWHACTDTRQVVRGGWFGERLWLVELAGAIVVGGDKVAAERARLLEPLPWDERVARLWVCAVAERVLPIYEGRYPDDDRPRRAIEVSRAFAEGAASAADLDAAGRAAGRAARGAAGAAEAAEAAAWAARGARGAARGAAGAADAAAAARGAAAAWGAARGADWHTSAVGERTWQAHHLAVTLGLDGTTLDGSKEDT